MHSKRYSVIVNKNKINKNLLGRLLVSPLALIFILTFLFWAVIRMSFLVASAYATGKTSRKIILELINEHPERRTSSESRA